MNSTSILLLALLTLPSCQTPISEKSLNQSALYDPPMVSLKKGVTYEFAEGKLEGRGQFFHSDYSYQNAFLLGLKPPAPILK